MDRPNPERAVEQLSQALECIKRMQDKSEGFKFTLKEDDLIELHTTLHAAADSLAPPGSPYRRNMEFAVSEGDLDGQLPMLIGVVRALHAAYSHGYLLNVQQLVRGDMFEDFLDMAEHLIEQGYKDSVAVLAGGVLEEHLRQLCRRHGVDIQGMHGSKPASRMNDELVGAGAYSKLDAKNVSAWLGLRNSAAHGKFADYNQEQVKLVTLGVRELLARTLWAG